MGELVDGLKRARERIEGFRREFQSRGRYLTELEQKLAAFAADEREIAVVTVRLGTATQQLSEALAAAPAP